MNNNNKNFRKTHLKNPTICWKGESITKPIRSYIFILGRCMIIKTDLTIVSNIFSILYFFRMFRCYFKKRRTPTGFWNVKIGVFILRAFVYFGATFSFAAKGIGKNRCRGQAYSESKLRWIPRVCDGNVTSNRAV